jgi:hypothetical protein
LFDIFLDPTMLDPLTALSVAGTIVQFADFGTKVLTQSLVLLSRNGRSDVVAELTMVTLELNTLCAKLNQPLQLDSLSLSEITEQQALKNLCDAFQRAGC